MSIYHLESRLFIPLNKEEAWDFISNPDNLLKITPAKVQFKFLYPREEGFYQGQIFTYQLSPLPGFTTKWVSEITSIDHGNYFTDDQRYGPYTLWHHQHRLKAVEGGTEMIDLVHYALPFGLLGRFAHWLFVKKQLTQTFHYREQKLKEFFGEIPGKTSILYIKTLKPHV